MILLPTNRRMDKQTVTHSYNAITTPEIKRKTTNVSYNRDKSSNKYAEWNKPDNMLYDSIYIKL